MNRPNKPLTVEVKDEVFTISIGTKTLVNCAKYRIECYCGEEETVVKINKKEFLKSLLLVLVDETDESGQTFVHEMFDKAFVSIYENGDEGIDIKEKDDEFEEEDSE